MFCLKDNFGDSASGHVTSGSSLSGKVYLSIDHMGLSIVHVKFSSAFSSVKGFYK